MGQELLAGLRPFERTETRTDMALLVAVPFYRNERLVPRIADSLIACADELAALGAHVLLINDSPDYPPLADALARVADKAAGKLSLSISTNPENVGWLKSANAAMEMAIDAGADILLLNSDTVVFPGAIEEMHRVAGLDPMIAFVNPRSNNATLASLPVGETFVRMAPEDAHAAWRSVSTTYPALTYTPTAIGFCMLIRHGVIAEFGVFDEIYGGGYNEENDLVMRAGRCGYRAALANHAFVWHEGEQSLGDSAASKTLVEENNRRILLSRYPEYPALIENWFNGVDHMSDQLVTALLPRPDGRLSIAFDFSSFGPYHSGTQKAGVQLLKAAMAFSDRYAIHVLCEANTYAFHGMDKTGAVRRDPHSPEKFAAVFRVGQPFDWDTVRRLTVKGATFGVFMLDTIALDCSHLSSPGLSDLWAFTLSEADFIIYNSAFTQHQFATRFGGARGREAVSLHSLNIEDYRLAEPDPESVSADLRKLESGYVLVIGNHYPHKAVGETANRLAAAHPGLDFVALGVTRERATLSGASTGERPDMLDRRLVDLPNLTGFKAGELSNDDMNALMRGASVIVMPSHYEGFGLPLLDALALEKPFFMRALPPLLEIHEALGKNPNVHTFTTIDSLVARLSNPPSWIPTAVQLHPADAQRAAADVFAQIDIAIASTDHARIFRRFHRLHTLFGAVPSMGRAVPSTPPQAIARRVGGWIESWTQNLLQQRWAFSVLRVIYRALGPLKPKL